MEHHIQFDRQTMRLNLLDQRLLPHTTETFACTDTETTIYALKEMVVRGAPAIGVTAAWGCVLAALETLAERGPFGVDVRAANLASITELGAENALPILASAPDAVLAPGAPWETALEKRLAALADARPTAVNLAWAVSRMRGLWKESPCTLPELLARWKNEATRIHADDIAINKQMGAHGAAVIAQGDTIMTHCNAGALATAGYGTALGVIYAAHEQGKKIQVIANETRPFLQGARLTAYELHEASVPVTIACDNACALLMHRGMVDKVVVGADRIAANGDAANKIGTYGVALLAKAHNIPFYIAAPLSTIDPDTPDGNAIPLEERTPTEVTHMGGTPITPTGVPVYNFAFDVTPSHLIAGIITEAGILTAPYTESIRAALANGQD